MDTLSDVLNSVHFRGAMYGLFECAAPWGIGMPVAPGHVRLFAVVRGGCLIQFKGERTPISLAAGELVLCCKDLSCEVRDAPGSAVMPIEKICTAMPARGQVLRLGGGGAISSLMIGCFTLDAQRANPFVASLPTTIHLSSRHIQAEPGLETAIRLLISEVSGSGPGGDILVNRLSDAIFVQIIRAYIAQIKQCKETPGWLKALADPEIGAALNLIHEKPEAPWTVAMLAEAVSMSRTSFATKFVALVGQTPIDYLTSWRMQKAVVLICEERANVEEIATAVGYTSRAAFSKAFKKQIGQSPGEYRAASSAV
jgi:AraC-like DNA-binding protein